jgi:hypothetical protein
MVELVENIYTNLREKHLISVVVKENKTNYGEGKGRKRKLSKNTLEEKKPAIK